MVRFLWDKQIENTENMKHLICMRDNKLNMKCYLETISRKLRPKGWQGIITMGYILSTVEEIDTNIFSFSTIELLSFSFHLHAFSVVVGLYIFRVTVIVLITFLKKQITFLYQILKRKIFSSGKLLLNCTTKLGVPYIFVIEINIEICQSLHYFNAGVSGK
jgi:hypothetical protein